jgi:hypothetical protein
MRILYEDFRQWASQFGVCTGFIGQRATAKKKVTHYETKVSMLKSQPTTGQKQSERLHRNIEKLSQACITFEHINKQCYQKMKELSQEKGLYMNPLVVRFMRLNMIFFKKSCSAFS